MSPWSFLPILVYLLLLSSLWAFCHWIVLTPNNSIALRALLWFFQPCPQWIAHSQLTLEAPDRWTSGSKRRCWESCWEVFCFGTLGWKTCYILTKNLKNDNFPKPMEIRIQYGCSYANSRPLCGDIRPLYAYGLGYVQNTYVVRIWYVFSSTGNLAMF